MYAFFCMVFVFLMKIKFIIMKKIIMLFCLFVFSFSFSQILNKDKAFENLDKIMQKDRSNNAIKNGTYVDLGENEAFEKFKNSNIRIELGIKLREFNYQQICLYAKAFKVLISKMSIMNSTEDKNLIEELKKAYEGAENPILCKECYYLPYKTSLIIR